MALTGPRLLQSRFPAWTANSPGVGGSTDAEAWTTTIDLSGLTIAEKLTLAFDGFQMQHTFPPIVNNVPNPHFLALGPATAPTDPRFTQAYFPGLESIYETILVSEDPINATATAAGSITLDEAIYWRQAYYGTINTQQDVQETPLTITSMEEGGSMRPTTRDKLYIYRRLRVQAAIDPTTGSGRTLTAVSWSFPETFVTIAARIIEESDLAYVHRTAQSYQRG